MLVLTQKQIISTSKWHAEHLFVGQSTQQGSEWFKLCIRRGGGGDLTSYYMVGPACENHLINFMKPEKTTTRTLPQKVTLPWDFGPNYLKVKVKQRKIFHLLFTSLTSNDIIAGNGC